MDVIIDTNILSSDFRVRKNRFANLMDYLRRTGSAFVICKVVWDEALAEYAERIKGDIERFNAAWEKLSDSRFTAAPPLDLPDRTVELNAFEKNLRAPAKGVKVIIHSDYSRLDINEVVRRGVRRVRPASDAGEELRDVILWLHALDYAKRKGAPVAFISHDDTFIEDQQRGDAKKKDRKNQKLDEEQEDTETEYHLHPHLQKDLEDSGVKIKFYRFLLAFNRKNALRSVAATSEWLKLLGTPDSIRTSIQEQIDALPVQRQGYMEQINEASINRLDFIDGIVHEVDDNTRFAELRFKADLSLVVQLQSSNFLEFQNLSYPGHYVSRPIFYNQFQSVQFAYDPIQPQAAVNLITSPGGRTVRHTTLSAQVTVSVRIQGENVSGFEIDKFAFCRAVLKRVLAHFRCKANRHTPFANRRMKFYVRTITETQRARLKRDSLAATSPGV